MVITTTQPLTSKMFWVCPTPEGVFQCQQTETGWQVVSRNGNTSAVYSEGLPHQSAALASLWQYVLQSGVPIVRVNPSHLPDNPDQLKQIIACLQVGTLKLECFSPYHAHAFEVQGMETAFTELHCPQPLFPGAVNGPTFSYQRLVDGSGKVLSEVGNPAVADQSRQFTEACTQFQSPKYADVV